MSRLGNWFKIDNAGKIYTQVSNKRNPNVFRIAVRLSEEIDGETLRRAVNEILPRFPTFKTKIRSGFFWEYLDHNKNEAEVFPMVNHYCKYIDPSETKKYLFRVSFDADKLALEVFHTLSDGAGSLVFLESLIYHYLKLRGHDLKIDGNIKTADQLPVIEEAEDSYLTYYDKNNNKVSTAGKAYHIKGTNLPYGIRVTNARFPAEQMLALSRKHGATITEYLTALLMYCIYEVQIKGKEHLPHRPVKIVIPYNLRKIFKSQTLKNFSTYIKTEYVFDRPAVLGDILDSVKKQMKEENSPGPLVRRMSSTVKLEKNFFTRITPLVAKAAVMKIVYSKMGDEVVTTSFSNVGVVKFGADLDDYITACEVNLFTSGCFSMLSSAVTYKGVMQISFNRNIVECDIEKNFIRHLAGNGVDVEIAASHV